MVLIFQLVVVKVVVEEVVVAVKQEKEQKHFKEKSLRLL
jgi:hypothetical protein